MASAAPLRMIDTFSGIGGFSLAARWLGGIETIQFVECEPFCQRILAKHWPNVPIHDDICTFAPSLGSADIICGGFPCQDISQAGKKAGLVGERSGLFYELLRVICLVEPRYVVLENVAAITANGMGDVLGSLATAGYDTEWACIPAAAVGACHQRDRWWCIAYPQSERRGAWARQSQGQARYQEPRAGDQASGFASHSPSQCCNDLRAAQGCDSATPEPGDGDGADAAHSYSQRLEGSHQLGSPRPQWPAAIARLDPNWRSYLSKPVICRGDDGFPGRVDRLKALGNAVVPQVAMVPLARVLELHHAHLAPNSGAPHPAQQPTPLND